MQNLGSIPIRSGDQRGSAERTVSLCAVAPSDDSRDARAEIAARTFSHFYCLEAGRADSPSRRIRSDDRRRRAVRQVTITLVFPRVVHYNAGV